MNGHLKYLDLLDISRVGFGTFSPTSQLSSVSSPWLDWTTSPESLLLNSRSPGTWSKVVAKNSDFLIFATWWCNKPLIFQTIINFVWSINLSLKYQRFTPSGCKDIDISQIEFLVQTQFFYEIKTIHTGLHTRLKTQLYEYNTVCFSLLIQTWKPSAAQVTHKVTPAVYPHLHDFTGKLTNQNLRQIGAGVPKL